MILVTGGSLRFNGSFDVIDCSSAILQTYRFKHNNGTSIYDKSPSGIHVTGTLDTHQRLRSSPAD